MTRIAAAATHLEFIRDAELTEIVFVGLMCYWLAMPWILCMKKILMIIVDRLVT